eukprot:CAMPEP_0204154342 /NCGR_PEP_ID=MMETSP0361-20130328/28632_1 /ASSEMBLY_ACC=CAM_ASM_000343 /TAXON_ID=268821 /ORGANISM="Scrippsiella Hangoei, Strain SHTV-5" /LENGTH=296 /DNA_ID=CAMNT_0051109601 /DNA_START=48 /DNA_END=937 /DNA_ORIENTATION=+
MEGNVMQQDANFLRVARACALRSRGHSSPDEHAAATTQDGGDEADQRGHHRRLQHRQSFGRAIEVSKPACINQGLQIVTFVVVELVVELGLVERESRRVVYVDLPLPVGVLLVPGPRLQRRAHRRAAALRAVPDLQQLGVAGGAAGEAEGSAVLASPVHAILALTILEEATPQRLRKLRYPLPWHAEDHDLGLSFAPVVGVANIALAVAPACIPCEPSDVSSAAPNTISSAMLTTFCTCQKQPAPMYISMSSERASTKQDDKTAKAKQTADGATPRGRDRAIAAADVRARAHGAVA